MTTESKQVRPVSGVPTLLGAAGCCAAAAVVLAVSGAFASGAGAAGAGFAGAAIVLALFAWGALVVDLVATVLPSATLITALVTYGAQIATTGLVLAWVGRSGAFLDDRGWLAAGVVTGVLVWVTAQIVLTVRRRIPVYELPLSPSPDPSLDPSVGRPSQPARAVER